MELQGAKSCFDFLVTACGLAIPVFISDRHCGVAKWIRESHPTIEHFFDQWHIAKSIVKKMLAASKTKGCEILGEWTKAARNPVYWCSTSTIKGFGSMIEANGNLLCSMLLTSMKVMRTNYSQNVPMKNLNINASGLKLVL